MDFEIKKLQTETLSEYITEVRAGLGLSRDVVATRTGIKPKFLEALEVGHLEQLPPDVYVFGFLKQLAELYAVPVAVLIAQFKKERGIATQVDTKQVSIDNTRSYWSKIAITPKLLSVFIGGLFVLVTLIYIIWQVASINRTPKLEVLEPKAGQIVKDSFITVKGITEPGTIVTINDQEVFVESSGEFKTVLSVTGGQKELIFRAKNKFDKEVVKNIRIVADTQIGGGQVIGATTEKPLYLELQCLDTVTINVSIDGVSIPTETVSAGSLKIIRAKTKILLSVSNAGSVKAKLNDKDLGLLGRAGEVLTDIPFSAESINTVTK